MRMQLVAPGALIDNVAKKLEKVEQITPPAWSRFVKTGVHKERPPAQDNWWHIRAASILRKVSLLGPIGTSKLRTHYGGRKNRGHKKDVSREGSGSIIRACLQQLEAAELIKQHEVEGHKGRVITPKGQSLLDKAANEVIKQ